MLPSIDHPSAWLPSQPLRRSEPSAGRQRRNGG